MTTFYENARKAMIVQIESIQAQMRMADPSFDPDDPEKKATFEHNMLEHAASLAIAILVRLDVINNPANDQAQTSARELVKLLCKRMNVDPKTRLGIDLDDE